MDQVQQVMLHYRDTEGITFYMYLGTQQAVLGAKADVGRNVYKVTTTWDLVAPSPADPTSEILEAMLETVAEIRRERRVASPSEPDVQLG